MGAGKRKKKATVVAHVRGHAAPGPSRAWPDHYPPVPPGFIGISYVCGQCSDERQWLGVPERAPGADIVAWMDLVTVLVKRHHTLVSRFCVATTIQELAIPMPAGTQVIGGPRVQ